MVSEDRFTELSQRKMNFLSLYTPELNPEERIWKLVKKRATLNRYFQVLSDLKNAISQGVSKHSGSNEALRKLCVIN